MKNAEELHTEAEESEELPADEDHDQTEEEEDAAFEFGVTCEETKGIFKTNQRNYS
jgi:hypothetical protein